MQHRNSRGRMAMKKTLKNIQIDNIVKVEELKQLAQENLNNSMHYALDQWVVTFFDLHEKKHKTNQKSKVVRIKEELLKELTIRNKDPNQAIKEYLNNEHSI